MVAVMSSVMRITALAGLVALTAGTAHAQSWYNYTLDAASAASRPNTTSYTGLYTGPGGELYSASVNSFSMNLGDGASMRLFTTVLNPSAAGFWSIPGSTLVPGFAGSATTNYARGLYLDPAASGPSNVSGRLSFGLGGGLSMDFLGGLSRGLGNGFYAGPGSAFDNRMSTA